MTSNRASKSAAGLYSVTTGDCIAMAKLVQMVTHPHEHHGVTLESWREYVRVSMGLETDEQADHFIKLARRLANRILTNASSD